MASFLVPKISTSFDCQLTLPGSKSIALRQMAISALTDGATTLAGVPWCDDIEAMLDCLAQLGVGVTRDETSVTLQGPMNFSDPVALDARMSGASTRLLIGLAALRSGSTTIDGHPSLRVRTNQPLFDVLAAHGVKVESESGGLPAVLSGPIQDVDEVSVDGSISSQYITALLLIAPYIGEGLEIAITGNLVSRPYIDITINEMSKRGAHAEWLDSTRLRVTPTRYQAQTLTIEGDATAASYFLALATLHGSTLTINNLGDSTHQGDYGFVEVMATLGAEITSTPATTTVTGPSALNPLPNIDMTTMPDAALTLITLAAAIPSATTITGLSTLHHKECDRLECSVAELQKLGVQTGHTTDSISVPYTTPEEIAPATLTTYHDHRMAMAFSVLGSLTGTLTVDDEFVVGKTYPNYWQDYAFCVR